MIASVLVSGSVSYLYYSDRLLELPLALIGIALATVALAKLSKYFANNDETKFNNTVNYALKIGILLGLPACFGLVILAEELIITLFQYDQFDAFAAHNSSLSLIAYGSGLLAFIMVKVLSPVFLSRGDTKTPVKVGVIAMLSNIGFNVILAYYFSHVGLAIATSISAFINATLLYYYLKKQNIFTVDNSVKQIFLKALASSFIMVFFIFMINQDVNYYLDADVFNRVFNISLVIIFSAAVYFLSLKLFKININKL